ncbi:MAG: hypothetical protein HN838_07430 [Rhodospirillaceae bacterium]|nr:hypothetical protein [Rhodospirillaceae bacterium]
MMKYGKLAASAALAALIGLGVSTAAQADTTVVKMKFDEDSGDFLFEPAKVMINPGDTVVWLQDDADNEHNVAAYPNLIPEGAQPFESQMMTRVGESWSMTFDTEGSYFYHCHPHEAAGMKGLIVVGRESLPEEFRKPEAGDMSHDHGDGGHGDMDEMKHDDMDGMKNDGMDGMKHGDMDGMKHGDMDGMKNDGMDGMKHGDMDEMEHGDNKDTKKKESGHHASGDDDDGHHGGGEKKEMKKKSGHHDDDEDGGSHHGDHN